MTLFDIAFVTGCASSSPLYPAATSISDLFFANLPTTFPHENRLCAGVQKAINSAVGAVLKISEFAPHDFLRGCEGPLFHFG